MLLRASMVALNSARARSLACFSARSKSYLSLPACVNLVSDHYNTIERVNTYKAMFDKPARSCLVKSHSAFLRLGLQCLDLFKVLLHTGQFPEYRVLLRIHAMKSQISCPISLV